jgi:plasmid maintenance system killer protein
MKFAACLVRCRRQRVDIQLRICFRWKDGNALDVELADNNG